MCKSIASDIHGIGDLVRPLNDGEGPVWLSEKRCSEFVEIAKFRPHARITFDDGKASDIKHVMPLLIRLFAASRIMERCY